MAAYVSVQSGSWNDAATWGGGGYPSVAGDTATVAAGHTVTYNVSSAVELGQITLNGKLAFSPSMNTMLTLGHQDILINATGELEIGTVASPIQPAYKAEVYWNTTADNAKGVNIAQANGRLTVNGSASYFGDDFDAEMAANWTSGQTFTVAGDVTAKWAVGQTLIVHKYALYASYSTDLAEVTIQSLAVNGGNTDITISEVFPGGTWNAGGIVLNVARNVILSKLNANKAMGQYNTNRPRIVDNDSVATNLAINNAVVVGVFCIRSNGGCSKSVFRNGYTGPGYSKGSAGEFLNNIWLSEYYATYSSSGKNLSGYIVGAATAGLIGVCHQFTGKIYGCYTAISATFCNVIGDIYGNNIGISGFDISVTGNVYHNAAAFSGTYARCGLKGKLGYNAADVSKPNTYDFGPGNYTGGSKPNAVLRGVKLPAAGLQFNGRNSTQWYGLTVVSENHGQVADAHYTYAEYGDIIKNTSTLRTGGANSSIEAVPLSLCCREYPLCIAEWIETDVPASSQTRKIYIKGEGWSSFPAATELQLVAEYISNAGTLLTAEAQSIAALTDNTTWTEFTVTFTPAVAGNVRYRVRLEKYQASAKVYVDNALY